MRDAAGAARPAEAAPTLLTLDRLDLTRVGEPWQLAHSRRPEIDAHYAALTARNPSLWNGRILMLASHRIEGRTLVGHYKETDYASLLWWRDSGYPDPAMRNAFGMAALRGADGGFVLGRMAAWTANAGHVYFAAGTPDLSDVREGGRVDIEGSVTRELFEETGVDAAGLDIAPHWTAVFLGPRIALMRVLVSSEPADGLAVRIRRFLARQERAELDDVVVARSADDLTDAMPDFIRAYLRAMFATSGTPPENDG